jgi:hypothetical protein
MASEESVIDWLLARPRRGSGSDAGRPRAGGSPSLLGHMGSDGEWPKGRWTASTWTLLLPVACGPSRAVPAGRSAELLRDRCKPNGRWPLQKRIPGTLLVEMEKPGTESRWNTLRALRILRRREPESGS